MRFNSSELKQLASCQTTVCEKEGVLSLRIKEGKLWNKTDVLTERWCRLIGNLLFYLKGRSKSSEPFGVFVLENINVTSAVDEPSFVIECSEEYTYFLASSQLEAKEWEIAISNASYFQLKQRYLLLKQESDKLQENNESLTTLLELSLRCSQLKLPGGHEEPATFISVQHRESSHGFWTPLTQTDLAQGEQPQYLTTICFQQNDVVYSSSYVRFVAYQVEDLKVIELGTCECLYADLYQSNKENEFQLRKHGKSTGCLHVNIVKRLNIEEQQLGKSSNHKKNHISIEQPSCETEEKCVEDQRSTSEKSSLGKMFHNPIMRTYRFPTDMSHHISVQEIMFESQISFETPLSYLKLCIDEETKKISSLQMLAQLTGHWDSVCKRRINNCKYYLNKYNERMKHLMLLNQSSYFKKSSNKTDENLEFVPTNLHLQRMKVQQNEFAAQETGFRQDLPTNLANNSQSHSDKSTYYDIVTVGAASAHSLGFKQGGLLCQLTNMDEGGKSKKSLPLHPIAHCLRKGNKSEMLLAPIFRLDQQIAYQVEKLRNLVSQVSSKTYVDLYSPNKVTASHESLAVLSQKTCEFVTHLDTEKITSAVIALSEAQPVYRPMYDTTVLESVDSSPHETPSVIVNETCHVASYRSLENVKVPVSFEVAWEECKLLVKSLLSDVVKSVHGIITPDREERFLHGKVSSLFQHENAMKYLTSLRNQVAISCEQALSALTFQELTLPEVSYQYQLSYRRKLVFSQALSALTCGLVAFISSSITNEIVLHQLAEVGILYQVESLLSTYGNELGMLQDYAIGVMDLQNVTIKFIAAKQATIPSPDAFIPLLSGSTTALTVSIPLDEVYFCKLPSKLRSGNLIKVYPVIFNIGINEEQTLAEKFGNTSSQEYLNMEAVQRTLAYYDLVRDVCPNCISEHLRSAGSFLREATKNKISPSSTISGSRSSATNNDKQPEIMRLLNSLSLAVHTKKNKNVEVLQLASDICRRLNAVRVTSCKSAKDRTAMAVTLEQVRILSNEHRLSADFFNQALSCMRSEGTRRENTLKNVGARKYAFTSVQLLTFPKLYRPPEGTYGKSET